MGIQVQVLKQEGKNNFFISVLENDPNTEKLVIHSYVTVTLYDFDLYIIDAQYRSKADFALIEEALYQLAKKIKAPNVYLSFSNKDSTLNVINDIKAFVIAVFPWASRLDIERFYAELREPKLDGLCREL